MPATKADPHGRRRRPQCVSAPSDAGVGHAGNRRAASGGSRPRSCWCSPPKAAILAPLTRQLSEAFGPGCRVLGCSSAGGFAFGGYRDDRVVAIGFPAASFRAEAIWLRDLRQHMALRLDPGAADGSRQGSAGVRAGLVAVRAADDRRPLPARGAGRRHRRRGARRPAGARRLGGGRAAVRPHPPRASTATATPKARSSASSPAPSRSRRSSSTISLRRAAAWW